MESPHDDRFSSKYLNLAEERLGTVVLETTDDFFAEKEHLTKPSRGIFFLSKSPITVNIWTTGKLDGGVSSEMTVSFYG